MDIVERKFSMLTFLRRVLSSLPLVWANTDIYHWQRLRTSKPFRSDVYLFIKWLFTYEKLAKYLCTRDEKVACQIARVRVLHCSSTTTNVSPAAHHSDSRNTEISVSAFYPSFTVYLSRYILDYQSAIKLPRYVFVKYEESITKDVASSFRVSEGGSIYRSFCIRKSRRIHPFR